MLKLISAFFICLLILAGIFSSPNYAIATPMIVILTPPPPPPPSCTDTNVTPTPSAIATAIANRGDGFVICLAATTGMGGVGNVPANMSDWTAEVIPTLDSMSMNTLAGEIRGAGPFNSTCLQADNSTPAPNISGGCGSAQQTKIYLDNNRSGFEWHCTTSTNSIVISNIYFYQDKNSVNPSQGFLTPACTNSALYIAHHNDFVIANGYCNGNQSIVYTNRGLYYRNRWINSNSGADCNVGNGPAGAGVIGINHSDGGSGLATWNSNSTFGTADTSGNSNLYFEYNYVYNMIGINDLHDGGAREVWRYNEIHNSGFASHGFDSTGAGGGRGIEVYQNNFYCDQNYPFIVTYLTSRTGTGFYHSNTLGAFPASKCISDTTKPPIEFNMPGTTSCNQAGAWGWPGQGTSLDATHNSYPMPHQVGWGYNSGTSPSNPVIGTTPAFGAPLIRNTNQPGQWTGFAGPGSDGVEQSLEPVYVMNNTNSGNTPVAKVLTGATDCRAQAWSAQSTSSGTTLVVPDNVPTPNTNNYPIPYANVGQQAIMVLADRVGGTTPTVAIKVNGSNSCGTITNLTTSTSSGMRLSAWTCTITADGAQTVTFTHDSSSAARAGTVIFLRGLQAVQAGCANAPRDANPAVATVSANPYTAAATGTLCNANEIVLGYYALPVPITDSFSPGSSDFLPAICNGQCSSYAGAGNGIGRYVGVNGTTGASPVTVATTYRVVNGTGTVSPQQQDSTTTGATVLAGSVSFVVCSASCSTINGGNGTANFATVKTPLDMDSTEVIGYNRDLYDDLGPNSGQSGFTGAAGTGAGTAASIPNGAGGVCTGSVLYWANDVANGNGSSINQTGGAFKCGFGPTASAGHWPSTLNAANMFYIPYIMPHPLDTIDGGNSQVFSQQPGSNIVNGAAFSPAIKVTLTSTTADTMVLSCSSCSLGGTLTVTSTGGSPNTATWTGVTASTVGTGYTLKSHDSSDLTVSDIISNTFNIGTAPTITVQPQSQTIANGAMATLTVTVTGSTPFTYQWYQGSMCTGTMVGTNSSSFTTPALGTTVTYSVNVSNAFGNVCSSDAVITVTGAPVITSGGALARMRALIR